MAESLLLNAYDAGMLRIQVKAKQGREWPGVKGVTGNDILIFVDYEGKGELERPDFYILTAEDWDNFLNNDKLRKYLSEGEILEINAGMVIWRDGYQGVGVRPEDLTEYREKWAKIRQNVLPPTQLKHQD